MRRRAFLISAGALGMSGCLDSGHQRSRGDEGSVRFGSTPYATSSSGVPSAYTEFDNGETVEDFSPPEGWEPVIGSAFIDDSRSSVGSSSLLLESPEDVEQARVIRPFDDEIDLSDIVPGLTLASTITTVVLIQFIDSHGNRIEYHQRVEPIETFSRYHFGIRYVDRDVDLSRIEAIQLAYFTGEDTVGRLWIDDLHFLTRPTPGRVMIHFDGGYESVYHDGLPTLSEHGIDASVFVSTERVRDEPEHEGDRLTFDQLDAIADAGWPIGSYSSRGLNLTTIDEADGLTVESELRDARDWLETNGYSNGARFFSFPANATDERTRSLVEDIYDIAFIGNAVGHGYVTNPIACSRHINPSSSVARQYLDWTAEFGGITTFSYLDLNSSLLTPFASTMGYLQELVDAGEVEVIDPHTIEESFLI